MEDFFGLPDDEEEKAEGFIGEVGSRRIFLIILPKDNMVKTHFVLELGVCRTINLCSETKTNKVVF